ncbi:MAG: parallel beta-helix domain-containing protein [Chloroflexota bacterium]
MSTLLKWIGRIIIGFVVLLVAIFLVAAVSPIDADPVLDPSEYGAGASSVVPSYTGLKREFPPINEPADNPTTDERAELGRLLFFDPILSENNDTSCASCHHPDLGFADGKAVATSPDGSELARNTPGLWNVGYTVNLFWDGRLDSLEAQAEFPLTHPDEMGVRDTGALVAEVANIPEYADQFEAIYGEVSLDNIEKSLAAFQRTIITNNAPFDQYADGNFAALTPQQRRGLALFRSGATRCFECHTAPTFASETFRVVGVPSEDPGRAGVVDDGLNGAFKVPSLRNIALTAPYMHNGRFATLEEVVDFYADGGGLAHGAENVDMFVNGFELNDQEREDLVAYMHALTDESTMPEVPTAVPSGLPVIARQGNPARDVSASYNTGTPGEGGSESRAPMVIQVQEGESIQAAVDRSLPGDTIEVPYGIYHERVVIDLSDITLSGIPNAEGDRPVLDGQAKLSEGVLSSGNNFTVHGFEIRNYTDNGVLVEGVTNVHIHDILAEDVGIYGIYPVQSTTVLVENVEVSGVADAGIYAGQCEDVIIRNSVVYDNVIGIELENTVGGEAYGNHAFDNTVGILVVLLPQLTSKVSIDSKVYDNFLQDNNTPNFGPAGAAVSLLPPGIGLLILAADDVEAYNNRVEGNKSTGVAVFSLTGTGTFDQNELDVGPLPEGAWVHDNHYENNGYDPDQFIKDLGIPVGDILWDASGNNNRFDEVNATSFPPLLPSDNWPSIVRRSYGNLLRFVIGLVA